MSNFITEASTELEHVVWPTPAENKKYMIYTIGVIVVLGIFLAVLGYIVTNGLALARSQFPHDVISATVSGEDNLKKGELNNILKKIKANTGTTVSGNKNITGSGILTGSGNK